jgi:high-affinity K+ transport system ATPase subunit B
MTRTTFTLFDPKLVKPAIRDSFVKLDPRVQWRNPVMFVVYVGSIITSMLFIQALAGKGEASAWFILAIALWLWFTVLFANFAEALAEGRSKAQAASLRSLKKETWAKKLEAPATTPGGSRASRRTCARATSATSSRATWCPPTARSSRASPRSTRARSRASPRP